MIHREVAEEVVKSIPSKFNAAKMVFAGFNALTKAEEVLMSRFVEEGAQLFWDTDAYYYSNPHQEAGQFFRQYKKHSILSRTFSEPPSNFLTNGKKIDLTGVPQRIGQAKHVGQLLTELKTNTAPEKTVIVLPDESMLLPLLHSIPPELKEVNVTMGFPLKNTPLYTLLDLMIELQLYVRGNAFSHRQVMPILSHSYITALGGEIASSLRKEIVEQNRIFISGSRFEEEKNILSTVFKSTDPAEATDYLLSVVLLLGSSFSSNQNLDREFAFHFHRHLSRLQEVLQESDKPADWRGFQKLFRQVVQSQKIPFSGEPLKGLQIMGVLETRNLDFENVFILSLNEGMLPPSARQGSYIPHSIRKAYSLPSYEHQDSIYSYLFYRLLQRAQHVHLYYNTEPDIIGNGEMSRLVQQLVYESGLKIDHRVLHTGVKLASNQPIRIVKDKATLQLLNRYVLNGDSLNKKDLSPSALNDYVDCRLRFYLKHLSGLREADEVEEDLDARIFGNLFHHVVHKFYEQLGKINDGIISEKDLEQGTDQIDKLIDEAFIDLYTLNPDEKVGYTGQRIVVRTIIKEFMSKIIERDKAYTPFTIVALEEKYKTSMRVGEMEISLSGKIDRVDEKAGRFRIIDYKTGGDELKVESISTLFNRETKRNKAAFQTMLYGYLFKCQEGNSKLNIIPGLMNRKNLFDDNFKFGHTMGKGKNNETLAESETHYEEFESQLQDLLNDLFNEEEVFDQTVNTNACLYCAYKTICRR
ncbi:MAG: hypothetical protein HC811_03855 [Flammeovirgaceae bacterium]|nr:hypothetical protein [Flammeovirgaceae bacterium]